MPGEEYNPSLDSIINAFERAQRTAYAAATAEFTLERMIALHKGKYDTKEFFRISEEIRHEWDAARAELAEKREKFHKRMGI